MDDVLESRLGSFLVSLYAIVSIALAVTSYFCTKQVCTGFIVVPILPWATLVVGRLNIDIPWAAYPLFLLLNAALVYAIGALLELIYHRLVNPSQL